MHTCFSTSHITLTTPNSPVFFIAAKQAKFDAIKSRLGADVDDHAKRWATLAPALGRLSTAALDALDDLIDDATIRAERETHD